MTAARPDHGRRAFRLLTVVGVLAAVALLHGLRCEQPGAHVSMAMAGPTAAAVASGDDLLASPVTPAAPSDGLGAVVGACFALLTALLVGAAVIGLALRLLPDRCARPRVASTASPARAPSLIKLGVLRT